MSRGMTDDDKLALALDDVRQETGVHPDAMLGQTREYETARARGKVYRKLRGEYGMTLPAIAAVFGRSQYSVHHHLRMKSP